VSGFRLGVLGRAAGFFAAAALTAGAALAADFERGAAFLAMVVLVSVGAVVRKCIKGKS
jgi:hypothetical protein